MTYHRGVGRAMAQLGMTPREPHVMCDTCGAISWGETRDGLPKAWLRNGKAPPGWRLVRHELEGGELYRRDYCKRCKLLEEK